MGRILLCLLLSVLFCRPAFCQGKKSVKSKPGIAYADSLFLKQEYSNAAPAYEASLKEPANKASAQAWNRLGLSYFNLKEYIKAIQAFGEAYKINPRFQGLFVNRARAYSAANDVTRCIEMLDSASQKLGFGNFKLLDSDPAFENLRKDSRFQALHDKVCTTAYPCLTLPEARQFDFWLGEWDVYLTSNLCVKTGVNQITRQSGGCVILESWEATGPHQGMSTNYYDPSDSTWKQKWAGSAQDIIEFYDGRFENNAMRFKWDSRNPAGKISPGRLTFTNLEPDKVRQHSETSPDAGKTWQTVYDFTYIRRK